MNPHVVSMRRPASRAPTVRSHSCQLLKPFSVAIRLKASSNRLLIRKGFEWSRSSLAFLGRPMTRTRGLPFSSNALRILACSFGVIRRGSDQPSVSHPSSSQVGSSFLARRWPGRDDAAGFPAPSEDDRDDAALCFAGELEADFPLAFLGGNDAFRVAKDVDAGLERKAFFSFVSLVFLFVPFDVMWHPSSPHTFGVTKSNISLLPEQEKWLDYSTSLTFNGLLETSSRSRSTPEPLRERSVWGTGWVSGKGFLDLRFSSKSWLFVILSLFAVT